MTLGSKQLHPAGHTDGSVEQLICEQNPVTSVGWIAQTGAGLPQSSSVLHVAPNVPVFAGFTAAPSPAPSPSAPASVSVIVAGFDPDPPGRHIPSLNRSPGLHDALVAHPAVAALASAASAATRDHPKPK
jgi:hypothetical protein